MSSMPVNQAEVWEAPFPYPDSVIVVGRDPVTGKTHVSFDGDIRPVVVVSNNTLNDHGDFVLACQVTTKIGRVLKRHKYLKQHVIRITDKTWIKSAGLDAPSAILPFKLSIVHKRQLRYKRGVLPDDISSELLDELSKFF
ncbi:type II toxin-antitoxin system PemK/MazF family toxin [Thermococcus sp.]